MQLRSLKYLGSSGFHRLSYAEWAGPMGARTLICVHGLTRNSRDFVPFAEAMSERYRVVAPDMPGRGGSDWLANPAEYGFPLYLQAIAQLIARLDVESVDWVGTSMGGLIGMSLAATPGHPIRRLVLNDSGAVVPKAFMDRLASYVGLNMASNSLATVEAAARASYGPPGQLTDAQWRYVAEAGVRPAAGGGWEYDYDPRIGDVYRASEMQDVVLWPIWDKVSCPTLLLRGGQSPMFARELAEEMLRRNPQSTLIEWPGVGHPPWLMGGEQIAAVRDYLIG